MMETKDIRRKNLRSLLNTYLKNEGVNKAQFAEMVGIPAAQLSQISSQNPVRNIGDIVARRIEEALGLKNGWLDVIHNDGALENTVKIESLNDDGESYKIKQLDVECSCGFGAINVDYPDVVKALELEPYYAKKMFGGRNSGSLRLVTAVGDSMLGTIDPGSLVVLDITINQYLSDGIYAFRYGDCMHIKRLQLLGDKIAVLSDNKAYEKWEINKENEYQFSIEGFVVGKWDMNYTRLG